MFSGLHKIDVAQSVRVIKQMTIFVNPARLTKYSFLQRRRMGNTRKLFFFAARCDLMQTLIS